MDYGIDYEIIDYIIREAFPKTIDYRTDYETDHLRICY